MQSGGSYAEHSYKSDAGLSEVGEAYAVALRDFMMAKRAKDREDPEERNRQRKLVVSGICLINYVQHDTEMRRFVLGVDLVTKALCGHC